MEKPYGTVYVYAVKLYLLLGILYVQEKFVPVDAFKMSGENLAIFHALSFSNYGGRGIRVVTRWKSFELFLEDMGVRPNGTSIDRINNDGNYTPRNCKWATRVEQNNKRRQCRYITYARKTQTIAQWCTELSLPYPRTYNRLVVQNMTPKQAFETPYIPHKNRNWSHT